MTRKILHVDMDAFYASVEQRDDPSLRGRPVIVGWAGERSVVCAASYEARTFGVHSAMPASRARRLCPQAVFIPPDFERYREASRAIRAIFERHTPLVEPLSLDEAYLDVTEELTGIPTATETAETIRREIREETRLTASAGVAPNKFLAKIASDWRKPDGMFVIRPHQVEAFLVGLPIRKIPGVGPATEKVMTEFGVTTVDDLLRFSEAELTGRFGRWGSTLWHLARGLDTRNVSAERETKSISAETTFNQDISEFRPLEQHLWDLTERVSARLKANSLAGTTVTLKLKSADFKTRTRARALGHPTQLASRIFAAGRDLLGHEVGATRFRLIGIGVSHLEDATGDDMSDLIDRRAAGAELAVDKLREKFGKDAVVKGITLEEE